MVTTPERRSEEGAGTVLAVAMLGVLVTVTVAAAGVVGVVATHRIAQSAADLAALAGAAALQDGGDACAQAAAVAGRNRARLSGCVVDGWNVSVVVAANTARLPGRRAGPARPRACRAGGQRSRPVTAQRVTWVRARRGASLRRAPRACTRRACCSAR